MKNKFLLGVIGVLITLLSSCSNNLSRVDAEKLIKGKYILPEIQKTEIGGLIVRQYYGGERLERTNSLLAKGLIRVIETNEILNTGGAIMACYRVSLTEEGKKYLVSQVNDNDEVIYTVKTGETVFGEITGIQTLNKFANVNYTLKKTNFTPFAINGSDQIINLTASFSLYDDGWRIN